MAAARSVGRGWIVASLHLPACRKAISLDQAAWSSVHGPFQAPPAVSAVLVRRLSCTNKSYGSRRVPVVVVSLRELHLRVSTCMYTPPTNCRCGCGLSRPVLVCPGLQHQRVRNQQQAPPSRCARLTPIILLTLDPRHRRTAITSGRRLQRVFDWTCVNAQASLRAEPRGNTIHKPASAETLYSFYVRTVRTVLGIVHNLLVVLLSQRSSRQSRRCLLYTSPSPRDS